jgi:hypothetical protein
MKFLFAILQAAILAVIGYYIFTDQASDYKRKAVAGVNVVAQEYIDRATKDKEVLSEAQATEKAQKAVNIGNKVNTTSGLVITGKAVTTATIGGISGFVIWFIAYFIIQITTKPLVTLLDSAWGNFIRYYVGATAATYIIVFVELAVVCEYFFSGF